MKKILLATTTLIGAAGLFSGAALAETPKITVGGYANFEAAYVSDDMDSQTTSRQLGQGVAGSVPGGQAKQRPHSFRSDTQVDFRIDGKNDAGLGYGGEVDLLADTSVDVQGRGFNASKTMVYLEGNNWGRFELGSNVGADGTMKIDAGTIARATGGINGDWSYFANAGDQFLALATLPLGYGNVNGTNNFTGDHTEENLNKVTYYTPRFAGLQLGVSYLPDQINRGQGALSPNGVNPPGPNRLTDLGGFSENIVTGGVNYDTKFGEFGFGAAATGEWGQAQNRLYEDLKAWNAGAKVTFLGFTVAGSYGDWGRSNTLTAANSKDTWYWDAGIAYEYGPFGASVTYLDSQFDCGNNIAAVATPVAGGTVVGTSAAGNTGSCQDTGKNRFHNISAGVDYKLAPGLTPYAEVSYYLENANFNNVTAGSVISRDNRGIVGIVGTQLNF